MRLDKKEEKAIYRIIIRNESNNETASFPIYEDDIKIEDLKKKLEDYIRKL